MKKRLSALTCAACLCAALALPAAAAGAPAASVPAYSDVAADAWYAEAVEAVSLAGYMTGTSETAFSPNAAVTRRHRGDRTVAAGGRTGVFGGSPLPGRGRRGLV